MARFKIDRNGRLLLAVVVTGTLLLSGCGDDPKEQAAPPASESTPSDQAAPSAAASHNVTDLNGDGEPDPMCGTQDFGGGLVLQIPCEAGYENEPPEGTRLVKDSLFRLPGYEADLTGISGSLIAAPDPAGKRVIIVAFNSDNLFETGSDRINSPDTLDATVRLVNKQFAGSAIQVRGHTDATGNAAANQGLSERRAANTRTYITGKGVQASGVTTIGFGSARPLALETNTDGSVSAEGRKFNRRVELVIRLS
jgi:outer membrane protein OmpA-like peptidoglycan-associated protein